MENSNSAQRMKNTNRNDPCPCGSGKKYKKCHLLTDAEVSRPQNDGAEDLTKASINPTYGKNKPRGPAEKNSSRQGSSKGKGRINLPRRSGG